MKYVKTFEGLFDQLKSDKNWYLQLKPNSDSSVNYKGINLVLKGFVAIKKEKVNPLLDIIKSISEYWYLIDDRVDLLSNYDGEGSMLDSISSKPHRLEFKISDTKEKDVDMPRDIANQIIEYVDNEFGIESWNDDLKTEHGSIYKENKLGRSENLKEGFIKYIVYIKYK
jgi:hypothetical protein